nr:MAG TPA: hypothetical protein [Crassvirales sp.]
MKPPNFFSIILVQAPFSCHEGVKLGFGFRSNLYSLSNSY